MIIIVFAINRFPSDSDVGPLTKKGAKVKKVIKIHSDKL